MKFIAALLALFGCSAAKADKIVVLDQTELRQLQSSGLIKLDRDPQGPSIEISNELMDTLIKMGRVKQIRATESDNCTGTGGGCEVPDSPK